MNRARLTRILWIGAAALLVAAALVAIVALVRGSFSETDGKILATLGATFLCGATGLAGLALAERNPRLGRFVAGLAPLELAIVTWWIWWGDGQTGERLGGTVLLATFGQLAVATNLLLLRTARLAWLAIATAVAFTAAVTLSAVSIWAEPSSSAFVKTVAVLWILAGLGWLLLPVLQRYTAAAEPADAERVLASLGDVELVATRGTTAGGAVEVEPRLEPGERLVLRRRPSAPA